MEKIKVTLKKSLIGRHEKHIRTANSLGLKKIGDFNVVTKTNEIDGKITQISYLVDVEAAD